MSVAFYADGVAVPAGVSPLARRGVAAALRLGRVPPSALVQVVWSGRERVRRLNRRFRQTDRYTDVIAFRYAPEGPAKGPFGDLYIAVPQARLNARRFAVPFREELARLCVHGTLHLLGYTDYVPREKARMWSAQEKILARVLRWKF
jgi:probable rRNA maturation factor